MHKGPYRKRHLPAEGCMCRAHPLYTTWAGMFSRCENKADPSYRNYGARGITVSRRWYCFDTFLADLGPRPSPKHSLDRIDNSKGYGKNNCRWATRSEQMLNRRKFKGSKLKSVGVTVKDGAFVARIEVLGKRHVVGYFKTEKKAAEEREKFKRKLKFDPSASVPVVARSNSRTGVRGVTPHVDGGFTARVTINGVRHYLGYFQSIKEAQSAIRNRTES